MSGNEDINSSAGSGKEWLVLDEVDRSSSLIENVSGVDLGDGEVQNDVLQMTEEIEKSSDEQTEKAAEKSNEEEGCTTPGKADVDTDGIQPQTDMVVDKDVGENAEKIVNTSHATDIPKHVGNEEAVSPSLSSEASPTENDKGNATSLREGLKYVTATKENHLADQSIGSMDSSGDAGRLIIDDSTPKRAVEAKELQSDDKGISNLEESNALNTEEEPLNISRDDQCAPKKQDKQNDESSVVVGESQEKVSSKIQAPMDVSHEDLYATNKSADGGCSSIGGEDLENVSSKIEKTLDTSRDDQCATDNVADEDCSVIGGKNQEKVPSKSQCGKSDDSSGEDVIITDQIFHSCPYCKEQLAQEELVIHLTKHINYFKDANSPGRSKFSYLNGSYICSSCPFRTQHRIVFTEHVRHHVVLHPYSCKYCKFPVKGISPLLLHHKDSHPKMLIKLEVQTSKLLGNIMSKLGPQAPAADDVLTLSRSQVRPRPIKPTVVPHGVKPIVIDDDDDVVEDGVNDKQMGQTVQDDGESLGLRIDSVMSVSAMPLDAETHQGSLPILSPNMPATGPTIRSIAPTPNLIQPGLGKKSPQPVSEIKSGRNQPVKIQGLVGAYPSEKHEGKTNVEVFIKIPDEKGVLQPTNINFGVRGQFYACLACNYESPSMDEFKSHMFAEIHCNLYKSLQKPCHSCGQQGIIHDRYMKPCPFIDELVKNIKKAKESTELKMAAEKKAKEMANESSSPVVKLPQVTDGEKPAESSATWDGDDATASSSLSSKLIPIAPSVVTGNAMPVNIQVGMTSSKTQPYKLLLPVKMAQDGSKEPGKALFSFLSSKTKEVLAKTAKTAVSNLESGTSAIASCRDASAQKAKPSGDSNKTGDQVPTIEDSESGQTPLEKETTPIESVKLNEQGDQVTEESPTEKAETEHREKESLETHGDKASELEITKEKFAMKERTDNVDDTSSSLEDPVAANPPAMPNKPSENISTIDSNQKAVISTSDNKAGNEMGQVEDDISKADDPDKALESDVSDNLPDLPSVSQHEEEDSEPESTSNVVFVSEKFNKEGQATDNEPHQLRKRRSAGRYAFVDGLYKCLSCPYHTDKNKIFRRHVWKHIHGKSLKCDHCPENIKYNNFQFCYLINGIMTLVHRMADWKKARIEQGLPITIEENVTQNEPHLPVGENGRQSSSDTNMSDSDEPPEIDDDVEYTVSNATVGVAEKKGESSGKIESIDETMNLLRRLSDAQTTHDQLPDNQERTMPKLSAEKPHLCEPNDLGDEPNDLEDEPDTEVDNYIDAEDGKTMAAEPYNVEENGSRFFPWDSSRKTFLEFDNLLKMVQEQNEKSQKHIQELAAKFVYKCAAQSCGFSHPEVESFYIHNILKHDALEQYSCSICKTSFTELDTLINHIEEHKEEVAQPDQDLMRCMCLGCDYKCSKLQDLKKHCLAKHPKARVLKCCFCYQEWDDLSRYLWHVQEHVIKEIKCPYCGITSGDKNMIQQHMMETHENQPRKIVVNTKIINRLEDTDQQTSQTEFIDYETARKQRRGASLPGKGGAVRDSPESPPAEVVKEVPGDAPEEAPEKVPEEEPAVEEPPEVPIFKCSKCSYSACTQGSVSKHENIHSVAQDTNQRFICPSCPHSFDNYYRLINHVQFHAGTNTVRLYHCSHCGFCTNSMARIEDHLFTKHENLPFKFEVSQDKIEFQERMAHCPECAYPFIWPQDFLRHIPTHQGFKALVNPFKARIAQLASSSDNLKPSEIVKEVMAAYGTSSPHKLAGSKKKVAKGNLVQPEYVPLEETEPDSMSHVSEDSENSANAISSAIDRYHCDHCEFGTNHFHILQTHMRNCHPEHADTFKEPPPAPKLPVAKIPPKSPTSSSSANSSPVRKIAEIRNRFQKGSFQCSHCPYVAKNMKYMWRHQQLHKKVVSEGWKCSYCEYRTETKKSATFHLRRYHVGQPELMLPISGGVTAEEEGTAEGDAQRDYAQMRSWAQEYTAPYSTTSARKNVSPSAVPALPDTLNRVSLKSFEMNLPEDMVFKSPIKCPKCPYTNKVKYNLIRHLNSHATEDAVPDATADLSDENTSDPQEQMESEESMLDTDTGDESGDPSGIKSRAPKDHKEYCHKIQYMDLYQCNECVFMHRYPSKVLRHYHYRHAKLNPYKCGHCKFDSVESGKVIRHIHSHHPGLPMKVIKRTVAKKAGSPEEDDGPESPEPEGVVMSRERDDIEQEEEGQFNEQQVIREQLAQYIEKKDGNIQRCRFCSYEQHGASAIKRHVLSVHMKIHPWACKYCSMSSVEINKVKSHIAMTHPDQPVKVIQRNLKSLIGEEAYGEDSDDVKPDVDKLNEAMRNPSPVEIKPEPSDGVYDSNGYGFVEPLPAPASISSSSLHGGSVGRSPVAMKSIGGRKPGVKMYHCAYCSYSTKWNIRDVRTHIFHVHQMRKNFMCKYCKVGSKTKSQVLAHCAKFHQNLPLRARDMRGALANIMPVQEQEEIVTVAVVDRSGFPILEVEKIRDPAFIAAQSEGTLQSKPASDQPIDLSVKRTQGITPINIAPVEETVVSLAEAENQLTTADKTGKSSNIVWKCKQCGITKKILAQMKYHQICYHLNLKPYSCPHCRQYFWKKQPVIKHIQADHPGLLPGVVATMDEKVDYFKVNIYRITPSLKRKPKAPSDYETYMDYSGEATENHDEDEDTAGLGGTKESPIPAPETSPRPELFKCRHCNLLMISMEAMKGHLADNHPDDPPEFEAVRKSPVVSVVRAATRIVGNISSIQPESSQYSKPPPVKRMKVEHETSPRSLLKIPELPKLKLGVQKTPQLGLQKRRPPESSSGVLYKCKHCNMATEGQTIIRHHVMVHLDYKPYSCPHCNMFRAVKSYPVKLHIQKTHSSRKVYFNHDPDSDLEEKIHSSYDKFLPPGAQRQALEDAQKAASKMEADSSKNRPKVAPLKIKLPLKFGKKIAQERNQAKQARELPVVIQGGIQESPATLAAESSTRRTVYKCMFGDCTYSTTQRPDVRRHIMREMKYKPYCCAYCDFREVNSGGMNRHFTRHSDKAPKIILRKNRAKEQRVEELIQQAAHVTFSTKKRLSTDSPLSPVPSVSPRARVSPRPFSPPKAIRSPSFSSSGSHGSSPIPNLSNSPRALTNPRASPGGAFKCPYDFCKFATYMKAKLADHIMRHGPHRVKCGHCESKGFYPSELRKHHKVKHASEGLSFEYINLPPDPNFIPPDETELEAKLKSSPLAKSYRADQSESEQSGTPSQSDDEGKFVSPKQVYSKITTTQRLKKATPENPMPVLDGLGLNIDLVPDKNNYYNCTKCEYRTKMRELLKKHITIHEPPRLRCRICKAKYRVMERLRRHSRIAHPEVEPEYDIIEPGDSDYEEVDLSVSIKVEKEDDYEQAEPLPPPRKKFKQRSKPMMATTSGTKSKLADSGGVQYCCHLCTFKASSLMDFTAHLYSKHRMGESPSKSKSVSRESSRERDLADDISERSSMSTNSELVPLKCWTCSFVTVFEADFNEHMRTHCAGKPFQCTYCDYCAFQRFQIKQHCMRVHPGKAPIVMERTPIKMLQGKKSSKKSLYQASEASSDISSVEPHLKASVKLRDILKIPQTELEELLSSNGITGIIL